MESDAQAVFPTCLPLTLVKEKCSFKRKLIRRSSFFSGDIFSLLTYAPPVAMLHLTHASLAECSKNINETFVHNQSIKKTFPGQITGNEKRRQKSKDLLPTATDSTIIETIEMKESEQ